MTSPVSEFDRVARARLPHVRSVEIILSGDSERVLDSMLFRFDDAAFVPDPADPVALVPGPALDTALRDLGWDGVMWGDAALEVWDDGVHIGEPRRGRFDNPRLDELWRAAEARGAHGRRMHEDWDRVLDVDFPPPSRSIIRRARNEGAGLSR